MLTARASVLVLSLAIGSLLEVDVDSSIQFGLRARATIEIVCRHERGPLSASLVRESVVAVKA